MLTRLDHIAIAVRDLALAERDYARLLGRTPAWQASHPAAGVRNTRFELDNTAIELVAPDAEGEDADPLREHLDSRGEGIYALALATQDLDASVAQLRERRLDVGEPVSRVSQDGPSGAYRRCRQALLSPTDTGGIRVCLSQSLGDQAEMPPSLRVGDESGCVDALDHVVVMTQDADRARAFYGDRLGIRLALDKTFEERGARILFFRLGGATIEVGAAAAARRGAADPDHLWGLAFRVADADAAQARVAQSGIEVSEVRKGFKPGTRVCSVKSATHGVATLLIEPSG